MNYHLEPMLPIIDGICYDDLHFVDALLRPALIGRGVVWETEFMMGQTKFCGSVIAASVDTARDVAFGRGLGETVIGPYREAVRASD